MTPAGNPFSEIVTAEAKPFEALTDTVIVVDEPAANVTLVLEAVSVKSGVGGCGGVTPAPPPQPESAKTPARTKNMCQNRRVSPCRQVSNDVSLSCPRIGAWHDHPICQRRNCRSNWGRIHGSWATDYRPKILHGRSNIRHYGDAECSQCSTLESLLEGSGRFTALPEVWPSYLPRA